MTTGFLIKSKLPCFHLTICNCFTIISVHTNNTTDSLCHLNDRKIAEHDAMSQTMHVHTFRQNRIVEDNELFIRVSTKLSHLLKEYFTGNFGFVDICTMLRCDVHNIVTHVFQLNKNISFGEHFPNALTARRCNKNFRGISFSNTTQNTEDILTINPCSIFTTAGICRFVRYNFGRNNCTSINQFLSRNRDDIVTINRSIVHGFNTSMILRSSSKEIRIVCICTGLSNTNKIVFLHAMMCLIKVHNININTRIVDFMNRIVGGEDEAMLTTCFCSRCKQFNCIWFGALEVVSFTTMAVHVMNVFTV